MNPAKTFVTPPQHKEPSTRDHVPINAGLIYALFFTSGACALVYEISWSRQMGLLFGHTAQAASVVLGSYFLGMAIGYGWGGRWAARVRPLAAYGWAEILAAMWVMLIPFLLWGTESSDLARWLVHPNQTFQTIIRSLYCFLLLLPATIPLGMTLPFIAEALSRRKPSAFDQIARAYGWNTAGAFVGVVLATFVLLVNVGVKASSQWTAGIGILCGIAAIRLAMSHPLQAERSLQGSVSEDNVSGRALIYWIGIASLSGLGTLALEILYTRLFSLIFHNSTYTFGLVIAVFLVSLSAGSMLASWLLRKFSIDRLISSVGLLAGVATVASLFLFMQRTGLEYFSEGKDFPSYIVNAAALVTIIVGPPVTMLGLLLPMVWKAAAYGGTDARRLGWLTMANTIAASAGAICASFLFLPLLGLWGAFALMASVPFVIALLHALKTKQYFFSAGTILTASPVLILLLTGSRLWTQPVNAKEEIVARWNSAYGWIDVIRSDSGNVWKVRQNLHYRFGATGISTAREHRQAHVPLLLHESPKDVLVMGLGTGMTAAGALRHPEATHITIVELIPEVVDAVRMLGTFNDDVVDAPQVTMVTDDARHYLYAANQRYDVIISDLFVPWESQTGYLYTVENYEATRSRLKPGGLFCQWLALYQLGPREFELIVESFASVFPETHLFWGRIHPRRPILALVGMESVCLKDTASLERRLQALRAAHDTTDPYLLNSKHFFELYLGKWQHDVSKPLNTDEHPRVEFYTPATHRNRELLSGLRFEKYYDQVFSHLPLTFQSGLSPALMTPQQHEIQRLLLFGESSPAKKLETVNNRPERD